jgi:hypothetical protein
VVKGEKCTGSKISKERLTVLLCGNMVGEMEKPFVTGKAAKSRCFKNLKIDNLPVIWRNNKKKKSLDDCSYNGRVVKHV